MLNKTHISCKYWGIPVMSRKTKSNKLTVVRRYVVDKSMYSFFYGRPVVGGICRP
jgi:hypothetical protein